MLRTISRSRTTRDFAVSSTLAIAVSLAAGGTAARAQSFQATPTVIVPGSATVTTGTNSTTVTLNSQHSVINWAPNDTAIGGGLINFQPSGTTATFVNNPSNISDFAVLNNILPTDPSRMVQFNGTVISQLQTLAGASSIGGTVYFYSPGGILVGPSAIINVGNLGLSASPIAYDAATGVFGAIGSVSFYGSQTVTFGQANAGSSVQIASGAQINANSSDGSYVAIVAPMVSNSGTINVNGNAALVSADAATITFQPSGLYSISVNAGTSATGNTLFNGGTITGPASTGATAHQIYMVTAPKNTLITLAIGQGSNLGFDVAGAADVSGNSVILSAGYDVINGAFDTTLAPKGTGGANVAVTNAAFTSRVSAAASQTASAQAFNNGAVTFASDASFNGRASAFLAATQGGSLTVTGSAQVVAIDPGPSSAPGTNVTAGSAQIFATTGGTVALNGAVNRIEASATGAISQTAGASAAGNGTGGAAFIDAQNGGSITVAGMLDIVANGYGGFGFSGGAGGNGTGGTAQAFVSESNGTLTFNDRLAISANGYGGFGSCASGCAAQSGSGTGGNVFFGALRGGTTPGGNSTITTTGGSRGTSAVFLSADGFGSSASNTNAGNGTGGSVSVTVESGNAINLSSDFFATANGRGGSEDGTRLVGGIGTGGNVSVTLPTGGLLTANRAFSLSSQGRGGAGDPDSAGTGSSGGAGFGGGACDATGTTCISGGATINSTGGNGTFNMGVNIDASGFGGFAGSPGTTGAGGAGTGGFAGIRVGARTVNTGTAVLTFNGPDSVVTAAGVGGSGYPGGVGSGGVALVRTFSGTIQGAGFAIDASGTGGHGATNATGGAGIGGFAQLLARNNSTSSTSAINLTSVTLTGLGTGGDGGNSFDPAIAASAGGMGTGGTALGLADAGDGNLTVSGLITGNADAFGGKGGNGAGNANGLGGNAGVGGAAAGGNVQLGTQSGVAGTTAAGTAHFGSVVASASAQGGAGGIGGNVQVSTVNNGNGGAGGNAADGGAILLVRGSAVTIDTTTTLVANAIGGNGGQGAVSGNGGNALIGTNGGIGVTVTNRFQVPTQRSTLVSGAITGTAAAVGGAGAAQGTSMVGDSALGFLVTNSNVTATSLNLLASAASVAPNALPSVAQLNGGTINLGSAFQFSSSGPITVDLDTATLNAGFVGLSGSDWILPATPPVLAGTINATTGASFSSGNNIVTYANVNFNYPVSFNVIGNFQLGNVTAQGDFSSFSGGSTTFGSLSASNVDIRAGGPIFVGPITTPGFVSLDNTVGSHSAAGIGDITVAAITAGRDLGVYSNGSVFATSPIQTGANVFIDALGSVTIGNVSAGLVNPSTVSGDTYEIAVRSGGALVASNLVSLTDIGLISAATISTGTLTGQDMLLLGHGNMAFGAINSSARVLIADAAMVQLGGTFGGQFDKNAVFAGAPVRSAGSITANSVSATQLTAATQQGFTSGALATSSSMLLVDAGAAIQAGNVSAPAAVLHASGAITVGTIGGQFFLGFAGGNISTQAINISGSALLVDQSAYALGVTAGAYNIAAAFNGTAGNSLAAYRSPGAITVSGNVNATGLRVATARSFTSGSITTPNGFVTSAGGPVTTGALLIGSGMQVQSDSDITTGDVDVGITLATTLPNPAYSAAYVAGGNISAGNIQARNSIILIGGGTATTGSLNTIDILGLIHGTSSYGPISASGRVLLADQSMAGIGVTTTPPFFYDPNLVFNAAPVQSAGPITVNGAANVGQFFTAATQQSFTSGSINSAGLINLSSGGPLTAGALTAATGIVAASRNTLTTGALNAPDIGLLATGNIVAGRISDNVNPQSSTSRVLIADQSMYASGAGASSAFDFNALFAATPAFTSGSLTLAPASIINTSFAAYTQGPILNMGISSRGTISLNSRADIGGVGGLRYDLFANGAVSINAQGNFTAGSITSGSDLTISATGVVDVFNLVSGNLTTGFTNISSGALTTGPVRASRYVRVRATGPVAIGGAIQAGAQVQLSSTGSITTGNINSGAAPQSTVTGDFYDINIDAGGALQTGNLQSSQATVLHSLSTIQTGTTSGTFLGVLSGGAVTTGSINSGTSVFANQSFYAGQGTATYNSQALLTAVNAQPLVVANVGTPGSIAINGSANGGALYAYSAQNVSVAGPVQETAIAILRAGGNITAGSLQGGFGAQAIAGGNVLVGDVTGGMLTSPTPVSGSTTTSVVLVSGGTLTAGNLRSFNNVLASSQQTIQTGSISTGDLLALGHGAVSVGPITATGRVLMADVTMTALGNTTQFVNGVSRPLFDPNLVFAAAPIASAGPITINGTVSAATFTTASAGTFTSGALTTTGFVDVTTGGDAQVNGAIQSGQEANVMAQGGITVGNVTAGANSGTNDPVPFSIGLVANGGPLVAGNLSGVQSIGLGSSASITTGTLTGTNLLVGGGTTITTGAINTSGRALLANYSMIQLGGTPGAGMYNANLVFAATPVRSGGAISINGSATVGQFSAASAGLISIMGPVNAGSFVTFDAGGGLAITGAVTVANGAFNSTGGGQVQVGNIAVTGNGTAGQISIATTGGVTTGNLSSNSGLTVSGNGPVTTGTVNSSGGSVFLISGNNLLTGNTTAATALTLNASGTLTAGNLSGASITLNGQGSGAIQTGSLSTTGDLNVNAGGNVATGAIRSNTVLIVAAGALTTGQTDATGAIVEQAGPSLAVGGSITSTAGSVSLTSAGTLTASTINAATTATLSSIGAMQTGSINAGNQVTISADSFALGVPGAGGTIVTTGGGLSISTVKALVVPNLSIFGNIALDSRTALTTGDVTSTAGSVALLSGGSLTAGALKAATTLSLTTPGTITAGNSTTFGGLTANGNITISGGDVTVLAGNSTNSKQALVVTGTGALNLDTAFGTTAVTLTAGTNLRTAGASATGAVTETAGGSIDTGQINAGGITINAGTTFQSGNLFSSKALAITSGGNLATANLTANGGSATVNSGGTLNAGVINSTNGIVVSSTGATTLQGLTSSGAIQFNSGSTFTSSGNIVAASQVIGGATGNTTLGNVTASGGVVELASSQGNLTTGRISALTDVAAIAGGSLSVGQVSGRDLVLLAGTNAQVGAIAAGAATNPATGQITGATGRVLIANASAGTAGGTFGNYNFNAVFNAAPVRLGGTVNLTGTVSAGGVGAYSQGAMTGQVINAFGSLTVESGGLVTVGQRWTSPNITIRSNDIAISPSQVLPTITTTAGLSSGTTGTVTLASLNASGAFIGDGLTAGQGYALSNAEVALVQSGSLTIGAAAAPGLATTMTIGNLSLTGPQAGSNVDNQQSGAVQFVTGNPQSQVPSGTIRVTGAVTAKGFLTANQLQFNTGTFELDTAAGSLTVTDSSNAQSGGIAISADRIHIAAASILDKLRVDPLYVARIADLNTAPTAPLANPVLSASKLIFAPTQTLYIQNTGTATVQAGFLVPLAGLTIRTPSDTSQSTARVSLVINGQFVGTSTTSGTGQGTTSPASITGMTAYQQFIATKPTGITADSQFNGCLIAAGSCSMAMTPTPDLSTQIQVLQTPALPSAPAIVAAAVQQASAEVTADPQRQDQAPDKPTEAEQKEEEKAQAAAKAPIAPPAPMIDTRPLSPPVSVDEPVAGGGNPALFGIGAAANPTEGGDK